MRLGVGLGSILGSSRGVLDTFWAGLETSWGRLRGALGTAPGFLWRLGAFRKRLDLGFRSKVEQN